MSRRIVDGRVWVRVSPSCTAKWWNVQKLADDRPFCLVTAWQSSLQITQSLIGVVCSVHSTYVQYVDYSTVVYTLQFTIQFSFSLGMSSEIGTILSLPTCDYDNPATVVTTTDCSFTILQFVLFPAVQYVTC